MTAASNLYILKRKRGYFRGRHLQCHAQRLLGARLNINPPVQAVAGVTAMGIDIQIGITVIIAITIATVEGRRLA
jgi:hypothetical protein